MDLTHNKALSSGFTRASGRARVDFVDGSVTVGIRGLSAEGGGALWLVDNLPGAERSARPEEGDRFLRVGTLTRDGEIAALEASLDPQPWPGFERDWVVVTWGDASPAEGGVRMRAPASGASSESFSPARMRR